MYKLCLCVAVLCLFCALACITAAVVEVLRGESSLGSWCFWSAAAFHFVAAVAGLFFLEGAARIRHRWQKESPQ